MGVDLAAVIEEDITEAQDDPIIAHIIDRGDDERPAQVIIMEARVNQTPLTALCGHVWVPSRDPKDLPICGACMEIFEFAKDFRGVDGHVSGM